MTKKRECVQTFDGKHHYAPRKWGNPYQGGQREVLACVCGVACPDDLVPKVKEQLKATLDEQRRQKALLRRLTAKTAPEEQQRLPI